jgi:hypothetical protein
LSNYPRKSIENDAVTRHAVTTYSRNRTAMPTLMAKTVAGWKSSARD